MNIFGRKLANTSRVFSKIGSAVTGMSPLLVASGHPELAAGAASVGAGLGIAGTLGSTIGNAIRP
jgi:hypothetical protein